MIKKFRPVCPLYTWVHKHIVYTTHVYTNTCVHTVYTCVLVSWTNDPKFSFACVHTSEIVVGIEFEFISFIDLLFTTKENFGSMCSTHEYSCVHNVFVYTTCTHVFVYTCVYTNTCVFMCTGDNTALYYFDPKHTKFSFKSWR